MAVDYLAALTHYLGYEPVVDVDVAFHTDDSGNVYISKWNLFEDQPSIAVLESIYMSGLDMLDNFKELREMIVDKQVEVQGQLLPVLEGAYTLDCTDDTVDLLKKAKDALKGTNRTTATIIDYLGVPGEFTIEDFDKLLGEESPSYQEEPIYGEIAERRLDLHEQCMAMIKRAMQGEQFEIEYT